MITDCLTFFCSHFGFTEGLISFCYDSSASRMKPYTKITFLSFFTWRETWTHVLMEMPILEQKSQETCQEPSNSCSFPTTGYMTQTCSEVTPSPSAWAAQNVYLHPQGMRNYGSSPVAWLISFFKWDPQETILEISPWNLQSFTHPVFSPPAEPCLNWITCYVLRLFFFFSHFITCRAAFSSCTQPPLTSASLTTRGPRAEQCRA